MGQAVGGIISAVTGGGKGGGGGGGASPILEIVSKVASALTGAGGA